MLAAQENPGDTTEKDSSVEAPAGSDKPKEKLYSITVVPYKVEYLYFRFYPDADVATHDDPDKRRMEAFYPGDYAAMFGVKFSADNLLNTGAYFSTELFLKYPSGINLSDSDKGSLSIWRLNYLWDNFGFDMEYARGSGFVHHSKYHDSAQADTFSIDTTMVSDAFTTNLYLQLFRDKYTLSENMEPLKIPLKGFQSLWDIFFLNFSYDFVTINSDKSFFTDPLVAEMGNENMKGLSSHLFNLSLSVATKVYFYNFFYYFSMSFLSVYMNIMKPDDRERQIDYGIESIFSSLKKYFQYFSNPFETYTKNLIMMALGYNNGHWYIYGQWFYDIKNLKDGDYYLQYNSLYMQIAGGMRF